MVNSLQGNPVLAMEAWTKCATRCAAASRPKQARCKTQNIMQPLHQNQMQACGVRTSISFLRPFTAKKKDATTLAKIAAMTGIALEMDPTASSSACVIQDAPDLPTCENSRHVKHKRVLSHIYAPIETLGPCQAWTQKQANMMWSLHWSGHHFYTFVSASAINSERR